jgi:hypothetical protein
VDAAVLLVGHTSKKAVDKSRGDVFQWDVTALVSLFENVGWVRDHLHGSDSDAVRQRVMTGVREARNDVMHQKRMTQAEYNEHKTSFEVRV